MTSPVVRSGGAMVLALALVWVGHPVTGSVEALPKAMWQAAPLPPADTFLPLARENLARSLRVQHQFAYKERRSELHTNPFGKIGTGPTRVYEVTPAPERGVLHRRLLERDGAPVAASEVETRQMRGGRNSPTSLAEIADMLDFRLQRREVLHGVEAIVVRFTPKPGAKVPRTREGRMARSFEGEIWIAEAAGEVMQVQATATEPLSFGMGVVARLNKGATVALTRRHIDGDVWLPTAVRFSGEGRAMLLRKLRVDYIVEWFDYRRLPGSTSPQQ